jgi:hypothetical protein
MAAVFVVQVKLRVHPANFFPHISYRSQNGIQSIGRRCIGICYYRLGFGLVAVGPGQVEN